MMTGIVQRIMRDRGFGFVRGSFDNVEYFFHRSGMMRGVSFDRLQDGDTVSFELEASDRGPRARGVSVIAPRVVEGLGS